MRDTLRIIRCYEVKFWSRCWLNSFLLLLDCLNRMLIRLATALGKLWSRVSLIESVHELAAFKSATYSFIHGGTFYVVTNGQFGAVAECAIDHGCKHVLTLPIHDFIASIHKAVLTQNARFLEHDRTNGFAQLRGHCSHFQLNKRSTGSPSSAVKWMKIFLDIWLI